MKFINMAFLVSALFSFAQGEYVLLKDIELGKIPEYAEDSGRLINKHPEIEEKDGYLWVNDETKCADFNFVGVNYVDSFQVHGDIIKWHSYEWYGDWNKGVIYAGKETVSTFKVSEYPTLCIFPNSIPGVNYTRGIYLDHLLQNEDNVTISLQVVGHGGEIIQTYDEYDIYDVENGLYSNFVRGAEYVLVTFPGNHDGKLLFTGEPFSFSVALSILLGVSFIIYFALFAHSAKLSLKCNCRGDDEYIIEGSIDSDDELNHRIQNAPEPVDEAVDVPPPKEKTPWELKKDKILKTGMIISKPVLHNLDVFTDIWYLIFIPVAFPVVWYLLLAWVVFPNALMILNIIAQEYAAGERSFINGFKNLILEMTQTKNLVNYLKSDNRVEFKEQSFFTYVMFFVIEDLLQFFLQLFNSLCIGRSWKYLQILGLFLSMKGVATRLNEVIHAEKSINDYSKLDPFTKRQINMNILIQIIFVYVMIMFVTNFFRFDDPRPAWAQLHSVVRWNLNFYKEYPEIV